VLPRPGPLQCAVSGCEFNVAGRKPLLAPCGCENYVCGKCVEVWAAMPDPFPCPACGAAFVAPFEARDCPEVIGALLAVADTVSMKHTYVQLAWRWGVARGAGAIDWVDRVSLLHTLGQVAEQGALAAWPRRTARVASCEAVRRGVGCARRARAIALKRKGRLTPRTPVGWCPLAWLRCLPRSAVCADCERDGVERWATWVCKSLTCDLRPLCDAHTVAHQSYGHLLQVSRFARRRFSSRAASSCMCVPVRVPQRGLRAGRVRCVRCVPTLARQGTGPHSALASTPGMACLTHCSACTPAGHAGAASGGAAAAGPHATRACPACQSCADAHRRLGRSVIAADDAAAAADAAVAAATPALAAGVEHHWGLAASATAALEALEAARGKFSSEVHAQFARELAVLTAGRDALLASGEAAFAGKAGALATLQRRATSTVHDLRTVQASVAAAEGSPDPLRRLHVARMVASKLALAQQRPVVDVDTTLKLVPDGRCGVYPLGHLLTVDVDPGRSRLVLAGGPPDGAGAVVAGQTLVAALTLVRADGSAAAELPPEAVQVDALLSAQEGACASGLTGPAAGAGVGAGAGAGTGAGARAATGSGHSSSSSSSGGAQGTVAVQVGRGGAPGAWICTLTAPPAPPLSVLTLTARVGGLPCGGGSPLVLRYEPRPSQRIAWDVGAGTRRAISADGRVLVTLKPTIPHPNPHMHGRFIDEDDCFRGRSTLLRTGPGVALDIEVRLETGPTVSCPYGMIAACFTLGVGDVASLTKVDSSSRTSRVAFLYSLVDGSVNRSAGFYVAGGEFQVHVVVLHVRGPVLTVSAGPAAGPMTLQRGSWPIPPSFYVLCLERGRHYDSSVTLSVV
jgi:hypothetical protein